MAPPGSHADRMTLPGVRLIAPLYQGSCDNLCGLYAIVNALTLTLTARSARTKSDAQALFDAGVACLDGRGQLAACLRDGIPVPLWREVAHALCAADGERTGIALALEQPFARHRPSRSAAFATIESLIRSQQAVLISLEGAYSHYSVICGYSATSFRLFDSNGLIRIRRDACGIGAESRRRHRLDLSATMVIAAAD